MPAVGVVGQNDPTITSEPTQQFDRSGGNGGPSAYGIDRPGSVLVDDANHRLFVVDSGNHRVLVFDLDANNDLLDSVPDHVLGQVDLNSGNTGVSSALFGDPKGLAWDAAGGRLFVADSGHNRVLAFDLSSGIADGMAASLVLGQPDFVSHGSAVSQSGLAGPRDLAWDAAGGRLFVADSGHNRVLAFDLSSGIADGMAASWVLGQPGFTTSNSATTQSGMYFPCDVDWDATGGRLFVADMYNHRVLAFDLSSGIADGMAASWVLGQPGFTTRGASASASGLNYPIGSSWDVAGGRLFVADENNSRVLVFDLSAGITDGMAASWVLGQPTFGSKVAATTVSGMAFPVSAAWSQSSHRLYVCEWGNNRVLVFDLSSGITDGMAASGVLGQHEVTDPSWPPSFGAPTFTRGTVNSGPFAWGFDSPFESLVDSTNHRLFVFDTYNNRVLVFGLDGSNRLTDRLADHVLGQSNFTSDALGVSATAMYYPMGGAWDETNQRLFVVDSFNSRVLAFDLSAGITDGMAASWVLGQPGFTTSAATTTQTGLRNPYGLTWDVNNQRLLVVDTFNHRVLVFDLSAGITDGMAASWILGQPGFTTRDIALSPSGMNTPRDVDVDPSGERIFVSDAYNHRVLVFDLSSGIADGMAASWVLGQPDFYSTGFSASRTGLYYPYGVAIDPTSDLVYVSDMVNSRVVTYDISTAPVPVVIDGGTEVSVVVNPDGSVTYTIIGDGQGRTYVVTLPAGALPLAGNSSVTVTVLDNNPNKPRLEVSALLPPGSTKSVIMELGKGSYVCVQDEPDAEFKFSGCNPEYRVTIPEPGDSDEYAPGKTISVDAAGEMVTLAGLNHTAIEAGSDEDGDTVDDAADDCPATAGPADYNGCPFATRTIVDMKIVDAAKTGTCGYRPNGKPEPNCTVPVVGAEVRVFDRDDADFRAAFGERPDKNLFDDVYNSGIGLAGVCVTDGDGACLAGLGDSSKFLAIVSFDGDNGQTVYTGKFEVIRKPHRGFADDEADDDDGDDAGPPAGTLVQKRLHVIKTIRPNGDVKYSGGKVTVVQGSRLDVLHPDYVLWQDDEELYPFVFTADENEWSVDVCMSVPEGYELSGVLDEDMNLVSTGSCITDIIQAESKVYFFRAVDVGSPEPDFGLTISASHPGRARSVERLTVSGMRKFMEAGIEKGVRGRVARLAPKWVGKSAEIAAKSLRTDRPVTTAPKPIRR